MHPAALGTSVVSSLMQHEADFWAEMRQFSRNRICLSAFDIANNAGLSEASVLHDFGKRNSRHASRVRPLAVNPASDELVIPPKLDRICAEKAAFTILNVALLISRLHGGIESSADQRRLSRRLLSATALVLLVCYAPASACTTRHPDESDLKTHSWYTNVNHHQVHSPSETYSGRAPIGALAHCRNGTWSFSEHGRGTCSHHSGAE
jgi:Protein of unknown function (DUF3761)